MAGRIHGCAVGEGSFLCIRRGYEDATACAGCGKRCGQGTADRTDVALKGQLSEHLKVIKCVARQLPRRQQNAERDREIEAAAGLRQVCWRQIDGYAAPGKIESRASQGTAYTFTTLAHRGFGQSHQRKRRQAAIEENLNVDGWCVQALQRSTSTARKSHDASAGRFAWGCLKLLELLFQSVEFLACTTQDCDLCLELVPSHQL